MDCSEVQANLEEYESKELPDVQSREIEKHFRECASCAKTKQILEATWSALDQLPVEEADPFAPRRFLARLQKQTVKRRISYSLAAACLVVLFAAQWLFQLASLGGTLPVDSSAASSITDVNDAAAYSELGLGEINNAFDDTMIQEDTL